MKVLVTGGLGFIGSHITDDLVAEGHDVVVVDSLSPAAHAVDPNYRNPHAEYHLLALEDVDAIAALCVGIDAVCHQAARVGLGVDFDDVTAYVADNDLGTAVLMRALHRVGFGGRFVQASSMVVYGEGGYACPEHGTVRPGPRTREALADGEFEPGCPTCGASLATQVVTEDQPLDPRNVYAATKLHQEHLGHAFAAATGSDVVSLRYHNVYGPRMPRDTPYAGVASIVRSACEAGRSPRVFEDGGQRRDFIHVADVALANRLALTAPEVIMGSYNIATGRPTTIAQMADAVCSGVGDGQIAPLVTGEYRIGDVRHITASPELAERTFGFRARIDAPDGLRAFATAPMRASLADPAGAGQPPSE
ncbi:MAG: NAD-dependent epimerase/dehydratase family protein [Candidatus Nanopelagicales bacterium]